MEYEIQYFPVTYASKVDNISKQAKYLVFYIILKIYINVLEIGRLYNLS